MNTHFTKKFELNYVYIIDQSALIHVNQIDN